MRPPVARSSRSLLFLLAACGGTDTVPPPDRPAGAENSASAGALADAGEAVACALNGSEDYKPVCTIEGAREGDATVLTVRQPDGGFHRLRKTGDVVAAADGAEPARVTRLDDGSLVVAVGDARYRLPVSARY